MLSSVDNFEAEYEQFLRERRQQWQAKQGRVAEHKPAVQGSGLGRLESQVLFYWLDRSFDNTLVQVTLSFPETLPLAKTIPQAVEAINHQIMKRSYNKPRYQLNAHDFELYPANKHGRPKEDYGAMDETLRIKATSPLRFCLVAKRPVFRSVTKLLDSVASLQPDSSLRATPKDERLPRQPFCLCL